MFRLLRRVSAVVAIGATVSWLIPQASIIAAETPVATSAPNLYQEAETLYKASSLAQRKGPVTSSAVLNTDYLDGREADRAILRIAEEIVAVGDVQIDTPAQFKQALSPYKNGEGLPARLKVIDLGENNERKERIEEARNEKEVRLLMEVHFFSDQDLVDLALLRSLFVDPSEKVLQQQLVLKARTPSELDQRSVLCQQQQLLIPPADWHAEKPFTVAFPALVVMRPTKVNYSEAEELKTLTLDPGDIVCLLPMKCFDSDGASRTRLGVMSLINVHDGKWSLKAVSDVQDFGKNWAKPLQLDSRQLLIRSYFRRARGLKSEANEDLSFLVSAYPNSKEALALRTAKDATEIALDVTRARAQLAAGNYGDALATAETVITKAPTGDAGKEAKELVQEIKKDAQSRLELASKSLDASDTTTARRELGIVLQVIPDDPTAKQTQTRCECMELLVVGEKALAATKWSQARYALLQVIKKSPDGALTQKAQAGLDRITAEGTKRFDEAKKLRADGKFGAAKNKVTEAYIFIPDNPQLEQYESDLEKEINEKFVKSGLKAQWEAAQKKLAELDRKYVAFQISGKITDEDIKRSWIIVFGTAIPIGDPAYKAIGTLTDDGAIQVATPDERCIQANYYMGGVHYLTGKTSVKNALGAEVPAWVYGPAPVELVKAQAEVEKLRAKIQALGIEPSEPRTDLPQ